MKQSYKVKNEKFLNIFKDLEPNERLLSDCSCALQQNILLHGRMYISQHSICFFSNILNMDKTLMIPFASITGLRKAKSAMIIPNALEIWTNSDKLFFTSLVTRDRTYMLLNYIWNRVHSPQLSLSPVEIWLCVHYCYGVDLGETYDDYVAPSEEEHLSFVAALQPRRSLVMDDVFASYEDITASNAVLNDHGKLSSASFYQVDNLRNKANQLNPRLSKSRHWRNSQKTLGTKKSISVSTHRSKSFSVMRSTSTTAARTSHVSLDSPHSVFSPMPADVMNRVEEASLVRVKDVSDEWSDELVDGRKDSVDGRDDDDIMSRASVFTSGESFCRGHEHFSYTALDEVFSINVQQMFNLLFTDHPLQSEFAERSKMFDVKQMPWPSDADDNGFRTRTISYSVQFESFLYQKRSLSVEKQVLYPSTHPGLLYMIDTITESKNVPYSDVFAVATRYCLVHLTRHSCRLHVSCEVKYYKPALTIIKGFINKNVLAGVVTHYDILAKLLNEEVERNASGLRSRSSFELNHVSNDSERENHIEDKRRSTPLWTDKKSNSVVSAERNKRDSLSLSNPVELSPRDRRLSDATLSSSCCSSEYLVDSVGLVQTLSTKKDVTVEKSSMNSLFITFMILASILCALALIVNVALVYTFYKINAMQNELSSPHPALNNINSMYFRSGYEPNEQMPVTNTKELRTKNLEKIYNSLLVTTTLLHDVQRSLLEFITETSMSNTTTTTTTGGSDDINDSDIKVSKRETSDL